MLLRLNLFNYSSSRYLGKCRVIPIVDWNHGFEWLRSRSCIFVCILWADALRDRSPMQGDLANIQKRLVASEVSSELKQIIVESLNCCRH
jgi:hypothetical protein